MNLIIYMIQSVKNNIVLRSQDLAVDEPENEKS